MGYETKQQAYFAWRDDYDNWKNDNFGIPWYYKDPAPEWSDYWCEMPYYNDERKTYQHQQKQSISSTKQTKKDAPLALKWSVVIIWIMFLVSLILL